MPRPEPPEDAWLLYRQHVPSDVREKIKETILTAAIEDFDAFLQVTVDITAELLAGNIHPEIAKAARAYLELALTAVTANAMAQKDRVSESNARLVAARRRAPKLPAPSVGPALADLENPVPVVITLEDPAPWDEDTP